jgi:hypothetical protein
MAASSASTQPALNPATLDQVVQAIKQGFAGMNKNLIDLKSEFNKNLIDLKSEFIDLKTELKNLRSDVQSVGQNVRDIPAAFLQASQNVIDTHEQSTASLSFACLAASLRFTVCGCSVKMVSPDDPAVKITAFRLVNLEYCRFHLFAENIRSVIRTLLTSDSEDVLAFEVDSEMLQLFDLSASESILSRKIEFFRRKATEKSLIYFSRLHSAKN